MTKWMGLILMVAWPMLAVAGSNYTFDIRQKNADGIYQVGEPITFKVRMLEDGEVPERKGVRCIIYHNREEVKRQDFPTDHEVEYSTALEQPGWCQLTVVGIDANGQTIYNDVDGEKKQALAYSGALTDPLQIRQGAPEPKDFDDFWTREIEKLRQIALEAEVTPVPDMPSHLKISYVSIPVGSGFRPLEGVVKIPVNAKPKSLPILLHVHGAGVHVPAAPNWQPPIPKASGVKEPALFMNLNAHGLANDQPKEYYRNLNSGDLKGYQYLNSDDPEKYYMKGMILRLIRALDYLKTLPEWNGKDVIVSGGSQGGAQSLIAGGIDSDVTFVYADVPAMCDHGGSLIGHSPGWPKLYTVKKDGSLWIARDSNRGNDTLGDSSMITTAGYFDAANFARRIQCQAVLRTGGWDGVCPPTSVFAAYNNIPSMNKQIMFSPQGGHCRGIYEVTEQQELARFKGNKKVAPQRSTTTDLE